MKTEHYVMSDQTPETFVKVTAYHYNIASEVLVGFIDYVDPNDGFNDPNGLQDYMVSGCCRTNVLLQDVNTGKFLSYRQLAEECGDHWNLIANLPAYPDQLRPEVIGATHKSVNALTQNVTYYRREGDGWYFYNTNNNRWTPTLLVSSDVNRRLTLIYHHPYYGGNCPVDITHIHPGGLSVKYYKLEDGVYYYWSSHQAMWTRSSNHSGWNENNLIPIEDHIRSRGNAN